MSECCYFDASHHTVGQARNRNLERHVGAYNRIAAQGFQHDVVDHQHNFIDPNTGVTTNDVEALWQQVKAKFKSMLGLANYNMIPDYLAEFCGTRDSRNILTSTFELKLPNSTQYELHGKNMAFLNPQIEVKKLLFYKPQIIEKHVLDG